MAYDDIVKALTVQITADDLTGGIWSKMGIDIKEAEQSVIALNQAWELGSKVYEGVTRYAESAIEALSAGGEYAEQKAGFEGLAHAYEVDGKRIVDSIRDITEGNLGLSQATIAASNAIKKGFSEDQTATIWAFAKKYSDVMGGDMFEISERLEKGILYQADKVNKQFDLGISKGMSMSEKIEILKDKTDRMGESVFNFGEAWTGMKVSGQDAMLEIEKSINDLSGEAGFEFFAKGLREDMRIIEKWAPEIAVGIGVMGIAITTTAIPAIVVLGESLAASGVGLAALTVAMPAFEAVMLGTPWGIAIAGVAGLVSALVELNSQTVSAEEKTAKMEAALIKQADAGSKSAQQTVITTQVEKIASVEFEIAAMKRIGDVENQEKAETRLGDLKYGLNVLNEKYSDENNERIKGEREEEKSAYEDGMREWEERLEYKKTLAHEETIAYQKEWDDQLDYQNKLAKQKQDAEKVFFGSNTLNMTIDGKTYYNPKYYKDSLGSDGITLAKSDPAGGGGGSGGGNGGGIGKIPSTTNIVTGGNNKMVIEIVGKEGFAKTIAKMVIDECEIYAQAEGPLTAGI